MSNFKEKFKKSWKTHHIIIFIVCVLFGLLLRDKVTFTSNTLYWTASTVVQAFGALVAIILAVGIHQIKSIMIIRNEKIKGVNKYFKIISSNKDKDLEAYKEGIKGYEKIEIETKIKISEVFKTLGSSVQSIAILIGGGLLILIATEPLAHWSQTSPKDANYFIIYALAFLSIESFYCIQLLLNRIRDVLLTLANE